MAVCPKCEAIIDCLVVPSIIEQRYIYTLDGGYEQEEGIDPEFPKPQGYDCPECAARLFFDEDEAFIFLKGQE